VPLAVQRDGKETSVEIDVMDIGRRGWARRPPPGRFSHRRSAHFRLL